MTNLERINKLINLWHLIWNGQVPNVDIRESDTPHNKTFRIVYKNWDVWSYMTGSWSASVKDKQGNVSSYCGTYEFIKQQLEEIPISERPEYKK